MKRVIFHIDVNSAFLSWSAVKLLTEGGPDIRLVPSAVSGDPSDRRSIITAASIPAKKLGIKTAIPVSMALRKCPNLVIVHSDREWYRHCPTSFIDIRRSYSPVLQQFSIDECFIDMTFRLYRKDPAEVARTLKDEIKEKLGFTVNVGVGSNKLMAKMTSDFEKPDKVHTLWQDEVQEKMWPLPAGDLLWVGKKTRERLSAYGIYTIGDIAGLPENSLARIVGKKFATQMHDNANGIDNEPIITEFQEAKSISVERTFAKDIVNPEELDREMFKVACTVAHRLRSQGFRCSCVSMFIKFTDFSVAQKQCQISGPTDVTALILNEARRMLGDMWDGTAPIRQVGIGLSKFTKEETEQLMLFEDPKLSFYREWDRKYDEQKAHSEDVKFLAYERKSPEKTQG